MVSVIIKLKDVDRLGLERLNEIYEFLHDENILSEFEEMEEVKNVFLNKLIFNYFETLHRENKISEEKKNELNNNKKKNL